MRIFRSYRQQQSRTGAVTPLVAIMMIVLFSFVAIAVDGGMLLTERRRAQATADAAAMAAACVLYDNYPVDQGLGQIGNPKGAALSVASANGYSDDGTTSSVTVNLPPTSGPYAGLPSYVEVIVTYYQPRAFSGIFGSGALPVKARAVARGAWIDPNVGVLVLNYAGKGTLSVQGNGAFTEVGAKVIVNSNNSSAVVDTGNGTMKAPEFDITGGNTVNGTGQLVTSPTLSNILTAMHPTPDPLAYLPAPPQPAPGTMTKTSLGGGNSQYYLTPGSYSNLPNFSSGDQVIFQQGGIYYLTSGGLNSQGANLTMDPTTTGGIMIYNAGTGTSDGINIAGNASGTVNLGPLTTGIYQGLTFFQARNAPEDMQISGNGIFNIQGTIYAPDALLKVTGNGSVSNIGSQYISLDLSIAGNGNVSLKYNGQVARTRILSLVE
jgi:hypothetical protein